TSCLILVGDLIFIRLQALVIRRGVLSRSGDLYNSLFLSSCGCLLCLLNQCSQLLNLLVCSNRGGGLLLKLSNQSRHFQTQFTESSSISFHSSSLLSRHCFRCVDFSRCSLKL